MDVVVEDVTQIWGDDRTQVVALDRFSHRFRSRRFSCLLGPSGCGKSTLIQIVGGLERATSGSVLVHEPGRRDSVRPLGADSVMVWQNLNLFPWRSVIDNVAFGLEMRGAPRRQRYEGPATRPRYGSRWARTAPRTRRSPDPSPTGRTAPTARRTRRRRSATSPRAVPRRAGSPRAVSSLAPPRSPRRRVTRPCPAWCLSLPTGVTSPLPPPWSSRERATAPRWRRTRACDR